MPFLRALIVSRLRCRHCSFSSLLTFEKQSKSSGKEGSSSQELPQDKPQFGDHALSNHRDGHRNHVSSMQDDSSHKATSKSGEWSKGYDNFDHLVGRKDDTRHQKQIQKNSSRYKNSRKESFRDEWDEGEDGTWDLNDNGHDSFPTKWSRKHNQWSDKSETPKKFAEKIDKGSKVTTADGDHFDHHSGSVPWHDQRRDHWPGKPRGSHVRPSDKPRGKKLRKKDKLGFIESELVDGDEDQVQVLYGLHPVQLALAAGRRTVHRVYHRQEATGGRLSRLLAECAARGVGTVPLPVTQLDTIARGTGVHQGVCARVGPLRPRPVSELLTELGYPPVATDPDKLEAGVADFPTVGDPVPVGFPVAAAGAALCREPAPDDAVRLGRAAAGRDEDHRSPPQPGMDARDGKNSATPTADAGVHVPEEERADDVVGFQASGERTAHRRRLWLLLDRVQDPMNFGSILRSSYFLGVDAILIPDKNSCPLSPTVSKASAGVLEVFPTHSVPSDGCQQLLQLLRDRGWQLLAAGAHGEQAAPAAGAICPHTDTLLVVGNEGRGVEPSLARLCRPLAVPARRPLADGVESLNVGVATGILLSQLTRAPP